MTRSQLLSQACDAADARRRQASRILLASLVVIGLGLVPLIATRALYLDDMSRALDGYFGWMLNARPAAEGIMRLLGFGDVLVNVAPLPQLSRRCRRCRAVAAAVAPLPPLSPLSSS